MLTSETTTYLSRFNRSPSYDSFGEDILLLLVSALNTEEQDLQLRSSQGMATSLQENKWLYEHLK
jgi:hypothetical protein